MNSIVVIPTYNEAESISAVLDGVIAASDSRILVVDDNSPDGTADRVRSHPGFGHRVDLLPRPDKQGLGAAYRAGFAWAMEAGYDVVVQMDADLSHPPELVDDLISRNVASGRGGRAEVVIGSRYVPGGRTVNWPWHRRLISRGGNVYVGLVLALPIRDATAGYRVYSARALRDLGVLESASNGYCFQIENTWKACRAGLAVEEVPITFTERAVGESKMSQGIVWEAVTLVLRWRITELRGRWRARVRGVPGPPTR